MVAPGVGVAQEAPQATPPANGLLAAATVIDDADGPWLNGVSYAPDSCADARVFDPCSTTSSIVSVITDGATTSGDATVTSATAKFNAMDVGRTITGAGIPASTKILSINSPTSIELTANATATATGVSLTIVGRLPGNNRPPLVSLQPFPVEAVDTCSAFGFDMADYEGRARRLMAVRESKAVEREFLLAEIITTNIHLQDSTRVTQPVGTTAQGLRTGLARLVQAIADYNLGQGMIHARPFLVEMWMSHDLLYREGRKLYTATGNLVVPGSGYTGAAPDGTAVTPTAEWAYATDTLQVKRSPIDVPASDMSQVLDRTTNSVTVRAQRFYSVQGQFCTIAAVKLDTTSIS